MKLIPGETYTTSKGNDVTYDVFLAHIEKFCKPYKIGGNVFYKCEGKGKKKDKYFAKKKDGTIVMLPKDDNEIQIIEIANGFSFKSKKSVKKSAKKANAKKANAKKANAKKSKKSY